MTASLAAELRRRLAEAAAAAAPVVGGTVTDVVGLAITVRGLRPGIGDLLTVVDRRRPAARAGRRAAPGRRAATPRPACRWARLTGVAIGDERAAGARRAPRPRRLRPARPRRRRARPPARRRGAADPGRARAARRLRPEPAARRRVDRPLPTGVRALDAFVPLGAGQRVGIMAGSGVGKSTLLGMAVRGTAAPVRVVALVGERGREVREFLEDTLDAASRERTVVVVATGDDPPLLRLSAAFTATRSPSGSATRARTSCSSSTRSRGRARPARGRARRRRTARHPRLPASVFAMLPRLLERAGPGATGSITALYTVLVEGDDLQDPVGDTTRGILDGHVVLDRALATAGHFPSIDVLGVDLPSRPGGPDRRTARAGRRRPAPARRATATSASSSRSAPTRAAATPSPTSPSPSSRSSTPSSGRPPASPPTRRRRGPGSPPSFPPTFPEVRREPPIPPRPARAPARRPPRGGDPRPRPGPPDLRRGRRRTRRRHRPDHRRDAPRAPRPTRPRSPDTTAPTCATGSPTRRTAVTAAARGVDEALATWHAARTDVRAVRTLHERYRATLAAADARREQLVLDDLAAGPAARSPARARERRVPGDRPRGGPGPGRPAAVDAGHRAAGPGAPSRRRRRPRRSPPRSRTPSGRPRRRRRPRPPGRTPSRWPAPSPASPTGGVAPTRPPGSTAPA